MSNGSKQVDRVDTECIKCIINGGLVAESARFLARQSTNTEVATAAHALADAAETLVRSWELLGTHGALTPRPLTPAEWKGCKEATTVAEMLDPSLSAPNKVKTLLDLRDQMIGHLQALVRGDLGKA